MTDDAYRTTLLERECRKAHRAILCANMIGGSSMKLRSQFETAFDHEGCKRQAARIERVYTPSRFDQCRIMASIIASKVLSNDRGPWCGIRATSRPGFSSTYHDDFS
jgi:hypothetical protein